MSPREVEMWSLLGTFLYTQHTLLSFIHFANILQTFWSLSSSHSQLGPSRRSRRSAGLKSLAGTDPVSLVVLVVQRFGVGLVMERSLVRLPAGALSSQLGQLSLPSSGVGKSSTNLHPWLGLGVTRSLVSGGR